MSRITHVDSSRLLRYGLLPEIQQTHEAGNQLDTVTCKLSLVASLTLKKVFDMVKASPTHPPSGKQGHCQNIGEAGLPL